MSDWLELLQEASRRTSRAEVARELGVSRASVSLLLNGKYPGGVKRMAARVRERYGIKLCPHTGRRMTVAECGERARTMPTSSPAALRQWRACQLCEHNPEKGEKAC